MSYFWAEMYHFQHGIACCGQEVYTVIITKQKGGLIMPYESN
jgi:hypothetical protein